MTAESSAQRLELSRERLRSAMTRTPADGSARSTAPGGAGSGAEWLNTLKALPGVDIVLEALAAWWDKHPMRVATMVATDAALAAVRPLARRHPLMLVGGAVLVGAALAWSRPWRGWLKPALLAGLLPQIISKSMARVPPQSWMAVLATLAQERG